MKRAAELEEEAAKIEGEAITPEESMASKDRQTPRSRKWQNRRGRQECKPYDASSRRGRGGGRGPPRGGRKGAGGITLSFGKGSRVWVKNYN